MCDCMKKSWEKPTSNWSSWSQDTTKLMKGWANNTTWRWSKSPESGKQEWGPSKTRSDSHKMRVTWSKMRSGNVLKKNKDSDFNILNNSPVSEPEWKTSKAKGMGSRWLPLSLSWRNSSKPEKGTSDETKTYCTRLKRLKQTIPRKLQVYKTSFHSWGLKSKNLFKETRISSIETKNSRAKSVSRKSPFRNFRKRPIVSMKIFSPKRDSIENRSTKSLLIMLIIELKEKKIKRPKFKSTFLCYFRLNGLEATLRNSQL